jgi:replication factor C subunit 2/4
MCARSRLLASLSHIRRSFHTCYFMVPQERVKHPPFLLLHVSCLGTHPHKLRPVAISTLIRPDNFRARVLELNASDERGISIVRERVKNFARQTPRAEAVASDGKKYPCPPYKIIILDEADSMTQDAQGALRRIMENYARITRFCLVCNYVTRCVLSFAPTTLSGLNLAIERIIEPLASRCSKFRFKPLDFSSARERIEHIAAVEQVPVDHAVISTLISTSSGDLRRAITYLQSAARLSGATDPPTPILPEDIQEIAGVVPNTVVWKFAQILGIDGPLDGRGEDVEMSDTTTLAPESNRRGFDLIQGTVKSLILEGYSASQILSQVCAMYLCLYFISASQRLNPQLHDIIVEHQTLTGRQKSACALIMAEADKALCDGADEELWILEVALRIYKAIKP